MKTRAVCCGCLAIVLSTLGGCVNLATDVVMPTRLMQRDKEIERAAPTRTPEDRAALDKQATVATLVIRRPTDNRAFGSAPTPIPNTYAGLELLNRAAGNGPDAGSELGDRATAEIVGLVRVVGPARNRLEIHYTDQDAPLDKEFLQQPSVRSFLEATRADLRRDGTVSNNISVFDAHKLASAVARSVSSIHSDPGRQQLMLASLKSMAERSSRAPAAPGTAAVVEVRLDAIASAYLTAYFEGKFVDREGTTISQPEIAWRIGNDTITSFEKVLLEALFDYATMTPVVHKKDDPEKSTPTFASLFPDLFENANDKPNERGVTTAELQFMMFLRGLGSEQSKHLSSALVRLFGGLHLSFIVGGKFSFGDNDTLAKVVATFCQEFVDRTVDALNYDFFEEFQYTVDDNGRYVANNDHNQDALKLPPQLGEAIAAALQYQDTLSNLLGAKQQH